MFRLSCKYLYQLQIKEKSTNFLQIIFIFVFLPCIFWFFFKHAAVFLTFSVGDLKKLAC